MSTPSRSIRGERGTVAGLFLVVAIIFLFSLLAVLGASSTLVAADSGSRGAAVTNRSKTVVQPAEATQSEATQSNDVSCPQVSCSIGSPAATIKSRKPAFIELDPYNLTIKNQGSIYQLETDLFFEGMSGFSSPEGPVLYVLSAANTEGTSSIYRWDFAQGALVKLFDLGFEAYALAHHGTGFYVAFYDSATTQHMVRKVGGASVVMPAAAGSLTYISDPAGDYLLAALRSNFVDYYKIALLDGEPTGAPTPVTLFTAGADTGR